MAESRVAYVKRLKDKLGEWGAAIDRLEARAQGAKVQVRTELDRGLVELRDKRAKAQQALAQVREASDEAWEKVRSGADRAWTEIQEAVDRAKSRFL
jgi:hypothetical protein